MRAPIIDTTATVSIIPASEITGDDDPGFYIGVNCPVKGKDLLPGYYEDRAAAERDIQEIFGP